MSERKPATRLIRSGYVPPEDFGGLNTPVHHASTVTFPNVDALRARDWRRNDAYTYGLHGTPTTFTLEARIAELENGLQCILAPSGLAAIALIDLALLSSGDEVLLPDNVYNPSRDLANTMLRGFGVAARYYDPTAGAAIAQLIRPETRLIWLESPGSITMEVQDVPAMTEAARARGVLTAIDNTWATGFLFDAFAHGVDISMNALTKYPSGGSDVLMGAVVTRDLDLHHRLKLAHMRLGLGVGGDDAWLVLRGLQTLEVRLRRHESNALAVARWLKARPEVREVLHPAFEDCPGHACWRRDFKGSTGLFSIVLQPDIDQTRIDAMVDALQLFRIGFSWGGTHSLAVPYLMSNARTAVPWGHRGGLVRFYVGLEDPGDLIADLGQAFTRLSEK